MKRQRLKARIFVKRRTEKVRVGGRTKSWTPKGVIRIRTRKMKKPSNFTRSRFRYQSYSKIDLFDKTVLHTDRGIKVGLTLRKIFGRLKNEFFYGRDRLERV